MSGSGKVVCVTGASGFIASYLVKLLLQRGYTVKASLRDLNDPKKAEHLLALDGVKEGLHLFEANLLEEGSFDPVVDGCECVSHTASPVNLSLIDPQVELIDPALKGPLNVLKSCTKVPSLKRVVLTSSITVVLFNGKPLTPDVVVDETWFSDPAFCEKSKMRPQIFAISVYRFVDIRDFALAHVKAFDVDSASGRYFVVGNVVHISEALDILRQLYPTLTLPQKSEDDKPAMPTYRISKEKAECLGINFTPLEVSLRDTVELLKDRGFLKV